LIKFHPILPFTGKVYVGDNNTEEGCMLQKNEAGIYIGNIPNDGSCGGAASNTSDDMSEMLQLSVQYHHGFITYLDLHFNVSCTTFGAEGLHATRAEIHVIDNHIGGYIDGSPADLVHLNLFNHATNVKIDQSTKIGDRVYLLNYLPKIDVYSSLYVENCTATDDIMTTTQLVIVKNGCPTEEASPLFYNTSSILSEDPVGVKFDMQTFKFHKTNDKVNFHCSVRVCTEENRDQCVMPTCDEDSDNSDSRQRRSLSAALSSTDHVTGTSLGVVVVNQGESN